MRLMPLMTVGATATIMLVATPLAAMAQYNAPDAARLDRNLFVFGGPFQHEWVWDTTMFWKDHYEDNFFAGVGYQNFLYHTDFGLRAGVEIGLGLRSGPQASGEAWLGAVARYDGLRLGDLNLAPAVTAGLSLVTDTIGVEAERARNIGQSVPVLFYLGPEISISHADNPNAELMLRIQHRSGGYGIIAPIDGSNAATLGMRFAF
ncbi:MAG TPA: hypothetical protein VL147_20900 [Devosia sp.]|nr:hypothetical protein [Devosia sp.]